MRRVLAALGAVLTLSASPVLSHAQSGQDRVTAKMLADEGQKLLDAKDYAGAAERFGRAYALAPAPTIAVALGRARRATGDLLEAHRVLSEAGRATPAPDEPASWKAARKTALTEAEAIAPLLAALDVSVEGPADGGAIEVAIDGAALKRAAIGVPVAMNPGAHTVVARAPGYKDASVSLTLKESEKRKVTLRLEPAPAQTAPAASSASPTAPQPPASVPLPPPPSGPPAERSSPWPTIGVVGLAAGSALVIAGVVTGLMAKAKTDDIKSQCTGDHCPRSLTGDRDSAIRLATISTIGFVVGAAGIGIGLYGITRPAPSTGTALRLDVGPGHVGLGGRF